MYMHCFLIYTNIQKSYLRLYTEIITIIISAVSLYRFDPHVYTFLLVLCTYAQPKVKFNRIPCKYHQIGCHQSFDSQEERERHLTASVQHHLDLAIGKIEYLLSMMQRDTQLAQNLTGIYIQQHTVFIHNLYIIVYHDTFVVRYNTNTRLISQKYY